MDIWTTLAGGDAFELLIAPLVLALVSGGLAGWLGARQARKAWLRHEVSADLGAARAAEARSDQHALDTRLSEIENALGLRSQLAAEAAKLHLEEDAARRTRIEAEIRRWSYPILDATGDLENRLDNILLRQGWRWLPRDAAPVGDFSLGGDYFLPSTVYVLCRYLCYVELMKRHLSVELFAFPEDRASFFGPVFATSEALSRHHDVGDADSGDAQIFYWQQRALGEIMIAGPATAPADAEAAPRCIGYAEFHDLWEGDRFARHLAPLLAFLDSIGPQDPRWVRLLGFRRAVGQVDAACRARLRLPGDGAATPEA